MIDSCVYVCMTTIERERAHFLSLSHSLIRSLLLFMYVCVEYDVAVLDVYLHPDFCAKNKMLPKKPHKHTFTFQTPAYTHITHFEHFLTILRRGCASNSFSHTLVCRQYFR